MDLLFCASGLHPLDARAVPDRPMPLALSLRSALPLSDTRTLLAILISEV